MAHGGSQDQGSSIEAALAALSADPEDTNALAQLAALAEGGGNGHGRAAAEPAVVRALGEGKRLARERGDFDLCVRLIDLELGQAQADDKRADLYFEKGRILADELLRDEDATRAFERVLELRPDDETAEDALGHISLVRDNWQKILHKYLDEAKGSTDRQLTGSLYLSVAELYAKFQPDDHVEQYLKKALETDPRSTKASMRLERLYRAESRWEELGRLYDQRAEAAPSREERVQAYIALGDLERRHRGRPTEAAEAYKKVLGIDPGNSRALTAVVDHYTASEAWQPLIRVYENVLRARPRGEPELGTLLQIAMIWWKKLGNLEAADEYWQRIRKAEPGHPAMLEFYRAYHTGDAQKLVPILQQAQRVAGGEGDALGLALETARAAEGSRATAERAIDLWKHVLRLSPANVEAVAALERLYERTEKWNALLELYKESLETLNKQPASEALSAQKIDRLLQMVRVYRDRLSLDMMVLSTYGQVLTLQPDHQEALTALAQRYEALGRWNDLISVLQRRADVTAEVAEKAKLLRRIADLWVEKFGNLQQAVRPLEELAVLAPDDADVRSRLRDLYTRRRAWRQLVDLERREEERLAARNAPELRAKIIEVAKLTAERLGDAKEAIGAWNRALELDPNDAEALTALVGLYEREKRWAALVEILRRQAAMLPAVPTPGETRAERSRVALLERAANLLSEKLAQADRAADLYKEILAIQPGHARATRTLQGLFAQEGRLDDLVALYGKGGQWDELYEVLQQTAERLPATEGRRRVEMLSRAAQVAHNELRNQEKAARAYERILALDTERGDDTRIAARALLPIYRAGEKWARLLAIYEVLLGFATDADDQLAIIREIRELCEDKLGSRGLAFSWAAKAYAVRSADGAQVDTQLEHDLDRLAEAAEAWDELVEIYQKEIGPERSTEHRLARARRLAEIARTRQHRADDARKYYELVLELKPGDPDALSALETLFAEGKSYPQLLNVYRQRESGWRGAKDDPARVDLLFKIAWIEEEKLNDVGGARATLQRMLGLELGFATEQRALRMLERIESAGGAERQTALAEVLERQLATADNDESRLDLLTRLAAMYAGALRRPKEALAHLERALLMEPARRATQVALEGLLDDQALDASERRTILGRLIAAYDERLKAATGDEVARTTTRLVDLLTRELDQTQGAARGPLLGRVVLLSDDLPDNKARREQRYAWAAERFVADPTSRELRRAFLSLAQKVDRPDDAAVRLADAEKQIPETDVQLRRDLLIDQADLLEGPLQMLDDAEAIYKKVLAVDPNDAIADAALERIFKNAERHTELRALYNGRKERALDPKQRAEALLVICELDENVLDDRDAAIASWREMLDLDPHAVRPFRALERLYTTAERFQDLEALLAAREPFAPSPREQPEVRGTAESRAHLRFRRAELHRERLDDLTLALDLYEQTLAEEPTHEGTRRVLESLVRKPEARLRVARMMQPIYEAEQAWPKLALVLGAERETLEGADAIPLLVRLAVLQEEKLGARQLALATWREALRIDPRDERVRQAVERLATLLGRFGDLALSWEEAYLASDASDLPLRADLLARSARLYERELRETTKAEAAWRRLFDLDPTNAEIGRPAAEALERLYESQEAWPRLVEVLRRLVEWTEAQDQRRQILFRIARIQEELIVDPVAATATYREILESDPSDKNALDGLEKLYAAKSEWVELADVLRRRLDLETDARARRDLLFRIAQLTERELEDASGAVAAYSAVLDEVTEDLPALDALLRLHEAAGRKVDLLEVLERRIRIEGDRITAAAAAGSRPDVKARDERNLAGLRMRAAALDVELGRPEAAIERYREILERDSKHEGALKALEALLGDPTHRLRVAELLEPRYAEAQDRSGLLAIHEMLAEHSPDLRERLSRLDRAAAVRSAMGEQTAAFAHLEKAARIAVGEPDLAAILDRLEASTPPTERQRLVQLYRELGPDILDAATQERVNLAVADESERLGDRVTAREYYRRMLDSAPDDLRALAALERIYEADEAWAPLYEIYARRAELAAAADDGEARRKYLLLGARLCDQKLDRGGDAVAAYEEALTLEPSDVETSRALEQRYEASARWHELADVLERRLGFTDDLEEAIALRTRLAKLFEQDLSDPERAIENYRAALGGDPSHADAIAALERYLDDPIHGPVVAEVLEPVYSGRHDWPRLVKVCELRLEKAEDPRARLALLRRVARIYEEQLEDLDAAFTAYTSVFREDPLDRATRDQLARLAGVLSAWDRLAQAYEDHVAEAGPDGDGVEESLRGLASIYHERLADVDKARGAYGRLLERDRDDEVVFFNLEKLLERNQRWPELLDAYREAATNTLDLEQRRRLLHKAALVAEQRINDLDVAIQLHNQILDLEPSDAAAIDGLDRLFQKGERWHDLCELVERRISDRATEDVAGWVNDKLRLAELRAGQLQDQASAVEIYEEVLGRQPNEPRAVRALERLIVEPEHTFRIAQILGPIYRAEGSWQKLVVIHNAELEFLDDRRERLERLTEIAKLHEEKGKDRKLAFAALLRAWRDQASAGDDPDAVEAEEKLFAELSRLAQSEQLFGQLCDELDKAVAGTTDDQARARVHRRVAEIAETNLADRPRAITAWEQVIAAAESDEVAWDAYLRLLAAEGRGRDLVKGLEKRATITSDPDLRRSLYERAALVYEEQLREAEAAIGAWRLVLDIEPEDKKALEALSRLYRARNELTELAEILDRRVAATSEAAERRALRAELALLAAGPLKDPSRAADLWRAALSDDARDRDALVELRKVELAVEHFHEALEATDQLVELTPMGPDRDALRLEAAELLERKLEDAEGAIERYAALIAPDAGGVGGPGAASSARRELERLLRDKNTQKAAVAVLEPAYEAANEWSAIVELGELMLDGEADPAERRRWLMRMADAQERASGDRKAAFSYWARAFREDPAEAEPRAALERIAEREAIPGELTRVYEELLATRPEPEITRSVALRLGELYEQTIGDGERAIVAYSQAIEAGGAEGDAEGERAALRALDRLLANAGRPRDLAEVLEKQAAATDDGAERVAFLHRLGVLRVGELVDLDGALNAFRDALEIEPDHAGSIAGLSTVLKSDPHREAALDLLEPIAERSGDAARQNQLAELRLGTLTDEMEQMALLERIAERAENALRDLPAALAAMQRAITLAPGEERLADEVERLATATGKPAEAATTFEALIDLSGLARQKATPTEAKRELALRAGKIWESTGATDRAEKRYLALLATDREDKEALEALERLYRVGGDAGRLAEILTRRAAVELDAEAQRALYAEAAKLAEESLGDRDGAIELWQRVVAIDETDADARAALARLYELRQRWAELADLLAQGARLADDPREQTSALARVAAIAAERLHDLPRAIGALRELLDIEPMAMSAIDSLIELEAKQGDDTALREALERKLSAINSGPARIPVFRRLAELAVKREDLGAVDDALGYLYEILAIDPNDTGAGDMQRNLLEKHERWSDLVDVLTAEASRRASSGDAAGELQLLVKAADVWEGKLGSPESAIEILERILERDRGNVRALLSLARIAETNGDAAKAREMLAGAEANAKLPADIAELAYRRGKVEQEAGDEEAASTHYRRALAADPAHDASIAALLEQARAVDDHAAVAGLLEAQIAGGQKSKTEAEARATRLELARLYIERLRAPDRARPHLEAALAAGANDPGAPEARDLLADLHFSAGRLDEARESYEALLKDALAQKKRGKEVAKLHLRIGEIAEKKGDAALALTSFSEAQRIDGGHAPTLVAVGRLQRQKGDWENARKVYRSLLLQNLDADAGITKAGVYLALGEIHEKLNEGPKAVGMYERGLETINAGASEPAEAAEIRAALQRLRG